MAETSPMSSRLDSPPPAPSGVVRPAPPAAPAGAMMSGGSAGINQNTLPQAVIERAMLVEQTLTSLSQVAPTLTPLVAGLIDQLRSGVSGALQGGGSGLQPPQPSIPGMGAGAMPPGAVQPAAGAAT